MNGNFTLAEFALSAAGQPVRIARARADFSQTSYGGWPVEAAIDGKPETGWGIDPAEGMRHVAVFELEQPLSCKPGTALEFHLDHAGRQHSIGRLRLSATSAKPPIHVPASETQFLIRGTVPPTKTGGLLAVSDAFFVQSNPHWSLQCKTGFTISGTVDGKPADLRAGRSTTACIAPRGRRGGCPSRRPTRRSRSSCVSPARCRANVEHRLSAHFVPIQPRGE